MLFAMIAQPSVPKLSGPNKSVMPSERGKNGKAEQREPAKQFVWGAGIECSFIPHLKIDQFEWTQHDRFWKEDFQRAKEELGISALRYALPWHKIEREPGKYDWSVADARIEAAREMGI